MAKIHFILQGKGGVGKSLVASFLYQHLDDEGFKVIGVDSDPVNNTFKSYQEFNVHFLDIMKDKNIDATIFDELIEIALELDDDTHLIIDNGASSFVALTYYLEINSALDVLVEHGHQVFLHTIITGGETLANTLQGLKTLSVGFPQYPLIVWLNSFFGDISFDGKTFYDTTLYKNHKKQFHSIIKMPDFRAEFFVKDIKKLIKSKQGFKASINSALPVMERQRLKTYWNEFKKEMANVNFNNSVSSIETDEPATEEVPAVSKKGK